MRNRTEASGYIEGRTGRRGCRHSRVGDERKALSVHCVWISIYLEQSPESCNGVFNKKAAQKVATDFGAVWSQGSAQVSLVLVPDIL